MEHENLENPAEKLLEAALRYYSEVEPRPGLEGRVLANIRIQQERKAADRWNWLPAFAAAAAVVVVGAVILIERRPQAVSTATLATSSVLPARVSSNTIGDETASSSSLAPPKSSRILPPPARSRHVTRIVSLEPHLEQFPARRQLSRQEELLLSFVKETHEEPAAARDAEDLQIKDLDIQPLQAKSLSSELSTTN